MRATIVLDAEGLFYGVRFNCPGCALAQDDWGPYAGAITLPVEWTPPGMTRSPHAERLPRWQFNGDLERPTFGPSVKTEQVLGHRMDHETDSATGFGVCHSFIKDGRIQFLADCTHALAGQTVDLPDLDVGGGVNREDSEPDYPR